MTSEVRPRAARTARQRPKRWTRARRALFLEKLAECSNVSEAARHAKMDRNSAYDLKNRDEPFAQAWRAALEAGYGDLELGLLKQAREGSERTETVCDGDGKIKQTKTVHSYPLTVAMRLFLSHRDEVERFRAERVEHALEESEAVVVARVRLELEEVGRRLLADETRLLCQDGRASGNGGEGHAG